MKSYIEWRERNISKVEIVLDKQIFKVKLNLKGSNLEFSTTIPFSDDCNNRYIAETRAVEHLLRNIGMNAPQWDYLDENYHPTKEQSVDVDTFANKYGLTKEDLLTAIKNYKEPKNFKINEYDVIKHNVWRR